MPGNVIRQFVIFLSPVSLKIKAYKIIEIIIVLIELLVWDTESIVSDMSIMMIIRVIM